MFYAYFSGFDTFAESGKATLFLALMVVYIIKAGLERLLLPGFCV